MYSRQIRDQLVKSLSAPVTGHAERADQPAPIPDLCESATIYPIDMTCDVQIRDASATVVRGMAYVELAVGQIMHLMCDDHVYHPGTIRWVYNRHFELAMPNAERMFRSSQVGRPRAYACEDRITRRQIDARLRAMVGRPAQVAIIRNVYSNSMLLDASDHLRKGQHIILEAESLPATYGRIMWAENGKIEFRALNAVPH